MAFCFSLVSNFLPASAYLCMPIYQANFGFNAKFFLTNKVYTFLMHFLLFSKFVLVGNDHLDCSSDSWSI